MSMNGATAFAVITIKVLEGTERERLRMRHYLKTKT